MSIVNRLQAIVKERGTTFKQLERETGLGNGTIRRWEEQSPRLDKLTKVADYLQVSLDYLVYGKSSSEPGESHKEKFDSKATQEAQKLMCDGSPLDEEEADLVAQNCALVGKVLSPNPLHIQTISSAMCPAWGNPKGLLFHLAGDNIFVAEFGTQADRARVIEG